VGVEQHAGIEDEAGAPIRDLSALEVLYRAERRSAVGLAVLLTGDASVGEELAQEAFVRIAPHVATTSQPGAYLRTIVINLCRDHGRRVQVARRQPVPVAASAPPPSLPPDVTAEWESLRALPDRQRHVLVLRYWLDLEPAEIAELLGIPGSTVRSSIRRGLASLKEVLVDER
jgi:RNA polymerase sigma-70 factor (ECF subfamily)